MVRTALRRKGGWSAQSQPVPYWSEVTELIPVEQQGPCTTLTSAATVAMAEATIGALIARAGGTSS